MIFGALFRNGQGKNQVDRFAIIGIKGQGLDQLQENNFNIPGGADTSMRYRNTITQGSTSKVFAGTEAFKDFPGVQFLVFFRQRLADQLEQSLPAVYPDACKNAARAE